ncbi:hypothetical protein PG994_009962 [Apiospora phragmitis]|uniref:Rhodopsin domain-containing protein n=1 Tax=Apiospora phragmitis TaxID=2905665 RepID=A0ABR1TP41_9PEZI
MVYVFPIGRDSQKAIIGGAVVFSLLPMTAVALRMVARSRLKNRTLDLSDWLIVLACIVAVAYQALAVACAVVGGMGYHMTEVLAMARPDAVTLLMELVTVVVIFWSVSLGLTKLSILALYTKIFSIGSFVLITQACAVFVVLWSRSYPSAPLPSARRVCTVSAVRLAEIIKIDMSDFPFSGGISLMFSALEPSMLVTAACIPLLRPLVSRDNSTPTASSYARGNTTGNTGPRSAPRMGGFSELPDDDGSTR